MDREADKERDIREQGLNDKVKNEWRDKQLDRQQVERVKKQGLKTVREGKRDRHKKFKRKADGNWD